MKYNNKGLAKYNFTNPSTLLGGADRDRTDDLLNAIQALSQLSYSPNLMQLYIRLVKENDLNIKKNNHKSI